MGLPWLGASLTRTFRGMTTLYTFPAKKRFSSCATWMDRFVRPSYMVSSTPSISRPGFMLRRTMRTVFIRSLRPSSA